ncbi:MULTISPECIES: TraU family protein [Citrobacter]|uniref:TraU family protein n=1 Tax=Citrobacter TaxID=544 RepID=UPI002579082A|nr:TraU family protein [Citrobacter sp. Cpo150]MDM2765715.1 TraU family protein [Citrobacter sp. Cpo150]
MPKLLTFLLSAVLSFSATASTVGNTIGQVYDIAEPDALAEIEQRVKAVDWTKELNKNRDSWGAFKGIPLPYAKETRTRTYVPFYTSVIDVPDKNGRILYPKGYTFNPLQFVHLPQRIVVISPGQEDWLKENVTDTDMVLYTHGDVLTKGESIGRPAFILDANLQHRLDIKVTPSIVRQEGAHLIIDEFEWNPDKRKSTALLRAMTKDMLSATSEVLTTAFNAVIPAAHAQCSSVFMNPVTDIGWSCIFPMRIAGVQIVGGEENPSSMDSPVCVCKGGAIPTIGLKTSFWEPKRIIDTVSDPYCMMPLGTSLTTPKPGTLGGGLNENNTSKRAFQQSHYYIFPAWKILDMFYDIPCLDDEGYDVAMMTEILPQWNNDILSLIINPEALLFANPISTLTCAADAAAASFGMPINALFWCMGSWGNAYPLSGSITSTDYVEANAGIAARTIYMMGRLGMLWNTSADGCYRELAPIWRKDRFKLQMMRPTRSTACIPLGREGLLWTGGKHDPRKDNFMWMMFEKKDCCVRYNGSPL